MIYNIIFFSESESVENLDLSPGCWRDDSALFAMKGESEGRDAVEKLGAVPRHTRMSYYGIVFEQSAAGAERHHGWQQDQGN